MSLDLTQIQSADPNLPDITAPGSGTVPTGFVTDAPTSTTESPTSLSTSSSAATTTSQSSATAAATQSAAASKGGSGLGHGDIAAIVVPIALLAIIVPILVLWLLDRKHRAAAEKQSSHRSSNEAILQKHSSMQNSPWPKGPKPARPERTPRGSVTDPTAPEIRNSLGLFNFELSTPSTPGTGWMTPNPRFSVARALQMRRSQPSVVLSQPRHSRTDSDRPRTGDSERLDPPPPYVNDAASLKPTSRFVPLERIGTLQHADRPNGPTMQPTMAPTLPDVITTSGALDMQQPGFTPRHTPHHTPRRTSRHTPRHTPRVSSEILQLPHAYGRVRTRSSSPTLSVHNGSNFSRPFSYTAPERISDVSGLSDEPEPWRRLRESNVSSVISPLDSDERSTIYPHLVL